MGFVVGVGSRAVAAADSDGARWVMIVEALDESFAALLEGTPPDGLTLPDGPIETTAVLEMLRGLAGRVGATFRPSAWLIVEDDEVVGLCSVMSLKPGGEIEIGYGVAACRRDRGIATRAVAAVLDWARQDPRVSGIRADTATDNTPSQRVLERNGFQQVGQRVDPQDGQLICWRRSTES
ncbi:MAG: GNAT family N-acetyltransferase [Phenylobacterium sp.]